MGSALTEMLVEIEKRDPAQVDALLAEVGDTNRVRVVKHAAVRSSRFGRTVYRKAMDEVFGSKLCGLASLVRLDELRIANGLRPRYLDEITRRFGGELVAVAANLRTTVGIDYCADSLGNSSSRPAVANYMALSENSTAPAAGDTTLTGEITTNGLARALATYAHTGGATSYTLSKTFTATGAFSAVQKEAIFNASSAGTMVLENTFTSTALQANDQLTVTHTINI